MATDCFFIPKGTNKTQLGTVLAAHRAAARRELLYKRIAWTVSHAWMQGMRPQRGRAGDETIPFGMPTVGMAGMDNRERLRFETALVDSATEQGRILSIDTTPAVDRRGGLGLGTLRDDSMAQAVCDEIHYYNADPSRSIDFAFMLATYGMAPIGLVSNKNGVIPTISLARPWEFTPLPAGAMGVGDVVGYQWKTKSSLAALKSYFSGQLSLPNDLSKIQPSKQMIGSRATVDNDGPLNLAGVAGPLDPSYGGTQPKPGDDPDRYSDIIVDKTETWLLNEDGTVAHWIVQLGPEWVALWNDYTSGSLYEMAQDNPAFPMWQFARHTTVGGFYGRAFVERLIPGNRAFEQIFSETIKNMAEIDRSRMLWLPGSMGVNQRNLRVDRRNRVAFYNPDITNPQARPIVVDPANSLDSSMRMLGGLQEVMKQLTGHSGIMYGDTKRVDSAGGLSIMAQQAGITIAACGESIDAAYRGLYRAGMSYVRTRLLMKEAKGLSGHPSIKLRRMDETVLGLQVNPQSGEVGLSPYSIPNPKDVTVTIANKLPVDKAGRLLELKERRDKGYISSVEYDILVVKEGLPEPSIRKEYFHQYQCAWLENVILFGDGETPGTITVEDMVDNHAIHYLAHNELASNPVLRYGASQPVRAKVIQHALHHKDFSAVPEQAVMPGEFGGPRLPDPEAAAMVGAVPPGYEAGA